MTPANKLELLSLKGHNFALVCNAGKFALSMVTVSAVKDETAEGVAIYVGANEWRPTIEGAIDHAIEKLNQ